MKPNYLENDDFLDFLDDNLAKVYKDEGFIFILLDKEYYLPGEILKGSIFFQLFNIGMQTELMLKLEGCEIVSKKVH